MKIEDHKRVTLLLKELDDLTEIHKTLAKDQPLTLETYSSQKDNLLKAVQNAIKSVEQQIEAV